jgi:hypothetical protein
MTAIFPNNLRLSLTLKLNPSRLILTQTTDDLSKTGDELLRNSDTQKVTGKYRGTDKSLARPGRKKATATEDFDVHISYL